MFCEKVRKPFGDYKITAVFFCKENVKSLRSRLIFFLSHKYICALFLLEMNVHTCMKYKIFSVIEKTFFFLKVFIRENVFLKMFQEDIYS